MKQNNKSNDILELSLSQEITKSDENSFAHKFINKLKNLFGYSYKVQDRNSTKNLAENKINNTFLCFYVGLVAKLAAIDGDANIYEENALISEFTKNHYNFPELKKFFKAAINANIDSEIYIRKLNMLFPSRKDLFEQILRSMVYVASADGAINKNEMQFLKTVVKEFKIPQIKFNEIFYAILSPRMPQNPYECLQVSKTITKHELNIIYRKLARQYHPDNFVKYPDICDEYKNIMQEKFDLYTKAYMEIKSCLK